MQDNTNTDGSSGVFWLYADHLGSTTVTARMDAIGGDLLSTLSYTAWGETRASSGTTPTSLRYTGQREAEAGLYFYQARWYDPYLNRWTQPDSIVPDPTNPLSYDRYAYVHNNPVNFNDSSGHYACGDGIDDPRCKQGDPVPNSTPSTPTTIIDQFGGIGGNPASALNIVDTWLNDHPDYNLFDDPSVWTLYGGTLVPRGEYAELAQVYYRWRYLRGESDLLLRQGNAQTDAFIQGGTLHLASANSNTTITGRFDSTYIGVLAFDEARNAALKNAGDLGYNIQSMYDPKTGTLLGQMSQNGKRGWRLDNDHFNWWDWSGGKKGSGGRYGHEFFPEQQNGPYSRYPGYASWEEDYE